MNMTVKELPAPRPTGSGDTGVTPAVAMPAAALAGLNMRPQKPVTPDEMEHEFASQQSRTARRGFIAAALFLGSVGAWATATEISGAVIAPSQFVSESNLKKVQHQTGGVVSALFVREGDIVQDNQLLIRLDDTLNRANLGIVTGQLDEFMARMARLVAERDGQSEVQFPAELTERASDPRIASLVQSEAQLFVGRRSARDGIRAQLEKRITQLRSEIEGLTIQRRAKTREAELIQRELVGVRRLFEQNLVQMTRLSQLEREATSLEGQVGQLTSGIAQAQGKIAETELQILQLTEDLRAEVMRELRESQARVSELQERKLAAEDHLRRVEIRAPASGVVHQLAVHTVGGVITPAEPAMLLVPTNDSLYLEARVAPQDIDQVAVGQRASVRLHAFNQRTTPEFAAAVTRVGADVVREQQTGLSYYVVRLKIEPEELAKAGELRIVPGMQADAFVETTRRTPFAYLMKPVSDQFARAFRER
jgi:HlyD family secretion protein